MDQPAATAQVRLAASRRLAELINGYQISAAIGAFARLGIADALAEGPASPAELAAQLGAEERSLARLLQATLEVGLFEARDDGRYALTPLGQLLRGDVEGSLRRLAIVSSDEWRWRAYGHLTHALRTGEPVMALGGFNGSDPSPTLQGFKDLVAAGKIHWFIGGGDGFGASKGGSRTSSEIAAWVADNFASQTVGGVTVYDLTSPS